jgi:Ser/Thr protein kinase RdoA (MazF antagonist)
MPKPHIVYSTFSSAAVKQLVLPHYEAGSDAGAGCTLFWRGLNDTYRVSANGRHYALRIYRAGWRTPSQVQGELRALLFLREANVPVAAPIARSDGVLSTELEAPEGARVAVLFDWIDGKTPRYNNATHAALYGTWAAQAHNATDTMCIDSHRSPLDMSYLLDTPLTYLRQGMTKRPWLEPRFEAVIAKLRARMASTEGRLGDWGFCHGDLHCGNALVRGDHMAAFDFDCCGPGWRVFDLATFRWAARLRGKEEDAWGPFIKAYLEGRPSAAADLAQVPLFVVLRHLWLMGLFVENAEEKGGGFQDDEFFENVVTFCEGVNLEASAPAA